MKPGDWQACDSVGRMASALRTGSLRAPYCGDAGTRARRLACCAIARRRIELARAHGHWLDALGEAGRLAALAEDFALRPAPGPRSPAASRASLREVVGEAYLRAGRLHDQHAFAFDSLPEGWRPAWLAVEAALAAALVAGSPRCRLSRLDRGGPDGEEAGLVREAYQAPFRKHRQEAASPPPEAAVPAARSLAWAAVEARQDGRLDPARLLVLSDLLEEAGMPASPCPRCAGEGTVKALVGGIGSVVGCAACGPGGLSQKGQGVVPHPLVAHLRRPGPHPVACWAVFSLLGFQGGRA